MFSIGTAVTQIGSWIILAGVITLITVVIKKKNQPKP